MAPASDLHGEIPPREIREDPVLKAIMASDGITEQALEATISEARRSPSGPGQRLDR